MSGKPLSFWLRKVHKWIGLVIGLQLLLWTLSGAGMALLDSSAVRGGKIGTIEAAETPTPGAWQRVAAQVAQPVSSLSIATLPGRLAFAVTSDDGLTRLFDTSDGAPITVDRDLARAIARSYHPDGREPVRVEAMDTVTLEVRDHQLPIFRADYDDEQGRTFYISGATGELLEARNSAFRLFDVLWMLHTMDYVGRDDFNHPIVIMFGFAAVWLAVTGFWLLFKTMWRHDISWLRQRLSRKVP